MADGATAVIRFGDGANRSYVRSARRALALSREFEEETGAVVGTRTRPCTRSRATRDF